MSERVKAGERGVHRFRTVYFSNGARLATLPDSAETELLAKQRLRASVQHSQAASFLIADCRLSDPKNPVRALLPKELCVRLSNNTAATAIEQTVGSGQRALWRVVLPWAAAVVTAGAGFWVFLVRTL